MGNRGWIFGASMLALAPGRVVRAAPTEPETEPATETAPVESAADGPEDLGWGAEDEVPPDTPPDTPAPGPAPPPVTASPPPAATVPAPVPPPTPEELDLRRRRKGADALAISGYVFVSLGGGTLVLLSMPAIIAAQVARNRAGNDPLLVSAQELNDRADRRERFAGISALAGLGGSCSGAR